MSTSRPGGRSARVREAVLAAAKELLLEKGPHGVAMPEVAARAGVAVTSLYRRWGDVASLLMDLTVERLTTDRPLPDTGSIAGDLRKWARSIAAGLRTEEGSVFFRVLVATARDADSPERRAALLRRREQIEEMVARARQRGEAAPEADAIVDHVMAPIFFAALVGNPKSEAATDALVARVLAGK